MSDGSIPQRNPRQSEEEMEINTGLIIKQAAAVVRGKRYSRMEQICEQQETISTAQVLEFIAELRSGDCEHANYLKKLADAISRQQKLSRDDTPA